MKIFYIALFLILPSISYSQNSCPGLDSLNYSGQWYHTVQIGSQCWLKENLNVGNMILAIKDQFNSDTIEKFCYNNDPSMCDIYGGLYQWREAMQYSIKIKNRGLCPIGWHIPSISDFDTLISAVGGNAYVLKQVGQGGGTNTSGFSAMLSGINDYTSFGNLGYNANYWSSNSIYIPNDDPFDGEYMVIWNDSAVFAGRIYDVTFGISIRCLKDNDELLLQSPYGIESWQVGSSHSISWGGILADKKIQIDYSTDNGISWLNILDSTPATDGNYNWTIPNTPSKNCKVKITDLNNPNSYSISDSAFRIYTSCPGGPTVSHGGKIYNTIMIGNQCLFKENLNIGTMIPGNQTSTTNGILEKYCYNNDTANCIKYGGLYSYSEFQEPDICPAFWHIESYPLEYIANYVMHDGNSLKAVGQGSGFGTGTNTSGFSGMLAGTTWGSGTFRFLDTTADFPWNFPAFIGTDYIDNSSSIITSIDHFGTSGSIRCVRDDIGPLLLKFPLGGEQWKVGSTQKISWSLSNVINIKIDYSVDNGSNWINIIPSTPTLAGIFSWTIPNTPSNNCKIRISSVNNPDTNNISTNTFRIYQVTSASCPGNPTIVYGKETYNTIAIGDQCWLKENLNIGTMIDGTQNDSDNGIIEKYCYKNDTANCTAYGGFYQWNEAMQYNTIEGTKGICPSGWHIPTNNDFTDLMTAVNNNGNDLKDLGQGSDLGAGTNASGFSAILSGFRQINGSFYPTGYITSFWSSTMVDSTKFFGINLTNYDNSVTQGGNVSVGYGFSVRCINDSSISSLPVELTSFTSSVINNNVNINWKTATETNTSSFDIEKKTLYSNTWNKIASVKASGNSTSPKQYSYTDKYVNTGKYNYRLKMVDLDGSSKYSNIITAEVAPPAKYELSNAYPNPWNPTTTIRYQVPVNILVTIKIFDALGKEVTTLVNEVKPAGSYEVTLNGKNLASGVYYYQMKAGNFIETRKITLVK
ncbi:MAG: FISUMP domain-containing protein [Ignavibacteriaceae bacterium]|nr:FISUMP domain-containing protein [Ignavibacteriaceae bacterium]